jgi:hypothetical protein
VLTLVFTLLRAQSMLPLVQEELLLETVRYELAGEPGWPFKPSVRCCCCHAAVVRLEVDGSTHCQRCTSADARQPGVYVLCKVTGAGVDQHVKGAGEGGSIVEQRRSRFMGVVWNAVSGCGKILLVDAFQK